MALNLNKKTSQAIAKYQYLHAENFEVTKDLIHRISSEKKEPDWMLNLRLQAFEIFQEKPMPNFGPKLNSLNLDEICYFAKATEIKNTDNWGEVPDDIKSTFIKLGIPEAEHNFLAGAGAQYESEGLYHRLKEKWQKKGVLFMDLEDAIHEHPEIVKKYFSKCIPLADHKFSALHYAVWSGGTFLYVPSGVKLNEPIQSYFRMEAPYMGQFEHTLIIVEDNAVASYIEGCSAPKHSEISLHAGGVEIFVGKNSDFRYSSIENWPENTFNLNTKRAILEEKAYIEWIGSNFGAGTTMLYPCSILKGKESKADHIGINVAVDEQDQDIGAKVIHIGKNTISKISSRSVVKNGGKSLYRGLSHITKGATSSETISECDTIMYDAKSFSDTIPHFKVENDSSLVAHEAHAGKISKKDLFFLSSRGLSSSQAEKIIMHGFTSPVTKKLPLEYAAELNLLLDKLLEEK